MRAFVRAHWPSAGDPLLAGTAPDRTTGEGRRRRDGQRQNSQAHAAAAAHEPGQRTPWPAAPAVCTAHVPARTSGYWPRRTSALIALVPPQVVRSILLHATRTK
jgi:hypothetical protein